MKRQLTEIIHESEGIYFINHTLIDQINIGDRLRSIDENIVKQLAEDIILNGQLHPILVSKNGSGINLVAGLHRLEAMKLINKNLKEENREAELSSYKLQVKYIDTSENNWKILEISENLTRNDLSTVQRKELAILYGQLTCTNSTPSEGCTPSKKGTPSPSNKTNQEKTWFTKWYQKSHIAKTTANSWWQEYKNATGVENSPGNATKNEQGNFFQWHKNKIENDKRQKEEARTQSELEKKQAVIDTANKNWGLNIVKITRFMQEYMSITNTNLDNAINDIKNSLRTD